MTTLKFADTHNMVAFLSKPAESDGFKQIVDFLNAQPIRYALTVNPIIYISCIEQFWSTGVVKTINGEVQLHALVDGKKIIISEAFLRKDLKLEYEEGIDCLPNSTIFKQLALMRYEKISQKLTFYKPFFSPQWKFLIHTILQCLSSKTTAWNEFSSTMASAIICLATNQKFHFSKYIFESMVRNLDNLSGKFLMYLRVVQVFLEQQLDDLSTHNRIYVATSHTKKIFANMRRVGKGFSGRVTPLFTTMVVMDIQEKDKNRSQIDKTEHENGKSVKEKSSQSQKASWEALGLLLVAEIQRKGLKELVPQPSDSSNNVTDEAVNKELGDSLVRAATTASSLEAEQDNGNITKTRSKAPPNESSFLGTTSGGGPRCQETMGDTIAQTRLKLNELMELCTTLQKKVLGLEKTKTTQANEIASLKRRVKKLEQKKRSRTHGLKRLRKVGAIARVESSGDEESLGEDASKQGRINAIDIDDDITLVSVQNVDEEMFDVDALNGEEVFVAGQNENVVEEVVDAAQVKGGMCFSRAKVETTTNKIYTNNFFDNNHRTKGQGLMIEEPVKRPSEKERSNSESLMEEVALKLQAEFDEEERLTREKAEKEKEANIALIEEWDDIQAKIDFDYQLTKRLITYNNRRVDCLRKQELFQQLLEQRRKHFATKRAKDKRNKPPT
ncbi:hypothetical protein Tco_0433231 [Tanacetum coccineum]